MVVWRAWKADLDPDVYAVHLRPRRDLRWHPADTRCWCAPTVETLPGSSLLVTHRPADGRPLPDRIEHINEGPCGRPASRWSR